MKMSKTKVNAEVSAAIQATGKKINDCVTSFDPLAMHEAAQAAMQKIRERNADAIAELEPTLAKLHEEIKALQTRARELTSKNYEAGRKVKRTWKDLAKELGLNKYLTPNGSLSRANAIKHTGGDRAKLQEVLDLYNKQFVPQVNALTRAAAEPYKPSEEDKNFTNMFNAKINEYNRLLSKKNELCGM